MTQIKKAKKEKKDSELVRWAEMFRAKTWEDLKELAKQNEVLSKMVVKLAELTGVEKIRMQCEAREHYAKEKRTYENMIKEQEARAEKEKNRADDAEARADNVESELQEIRNQLQEQQEENQRQQEELQRQQETILELQRRLAAQQ